MIDTASVKTVLANLVTHGAVFAAAWFYQSDTFHRVEVERLDSELKLARTVATKVETAQVKLEVAKDRVRTKYVKELVEVPVIIEKPVYTNICIDEVGVKLIND